MNFWIGFGLCFMCSLACFILGYLRGCVYTDSKWATRIPKNCGKVLIETSDPDGPYLFLDLTVPVDELGSMKKAIFEVDTNGIVRE